MPVPVCGSDRSGWRNGLRIDPIGAAVEAGCARDLYPAADYSGPPCALTAFSCRLSGASSGVGTQRPKQLRLRRHGSVRLCRNAVIGAIAENGTSFGSTTGMALSGSAARCARICASAAWVLIDTVGAAAAQLDWPRNGANPHHCRKRRKSPMVESETTLWRLAFPTRTGSNRDAAKLEISRFPHEARIDTRVFDHAGLSEARDAASIMLPSAE